MIHAQLTPDGAAVRLPLLDRAARLLDDLALAYAEAPEAVAALLGVHAHGVARLAHATGDPDMPEHERAIRAAEADGSREALLDECPVADHLDVLLEPAAARRLASQLNHHAASAADNRSAAA
ncbi:hypothetical protein H9Y04_15915 [Streptomyces sp. TRM66268-LWL]|uniref:Transcriptional regulator n=1 Tax=Streptomyces polyasparticus TaxID=2767826 RepID=A0ABR7SEX5_9ACTN|nr:hypothetical protein [Streptomyces polyasparticus]MBC9714051.1 hypothetical protein [Streptomyces polyasparticus]